jgi:Zn-dependent protease
MHEQEPSVGGSAAAAAERRLRNLQSVARHLARGGAGPDVGRAAADTSAAPAAPPAPRTHKQAWKRWGPVGVFFAFVLGKLQVLVPFLKFAQLGTLLSMLVAVWVYAQIWGVAFALGFVLLIFVHELGHALVMRQQGIPAGAPVFIPFVGAVIAMRGMPRNAYVEALVGIGGPILGSVGAFACFVVAHVTGSHLWYALASTGFLINLFNLIPISPLDGGRIVGVISRWLWVAGYVVGIGILLVTFHPLLLFILLFGLFTLPRTLRGPRAGYYNVAPSHRFGIGAAYFGLAALLALGMHVTGHELEEVGGGMQTAWSALTALFGVAL